jgi:hypothetical protein
MTLEEIKVEVALAFKALAPGLRECIEAAKRKAEAKARKAK